MDIEQLRKNLAGVDREILELVAMRQELARSIGELKDRGELSLRDFSQEKAVLERARQVAVELGVSTEVAEDLMHRLIRYSLTVQERQRLATHGGGSGQKALVIGGAGKMGAWFCSFLTSQGFAVEIGDPQRPADELAWVADWRDGDLEADMIVVAADIRSTHSILESLAEIRPSGVIFDIGSLKTPLRKPLEVLVSSGLEVTSIHPMFGPGTELLSGRHVIVVDLGCPAANRRVGELFQSTMAEVVEMRLDDHDRVVAYILGLSHALNIAFFTALAESGEAAPQLAKLSSTTFDSQLDVAAVVARDNPHLYFEIQHLNEYGGESLAALVDAVERVQTVVRNGDEESFAALMEQGQAYLADRGTLKR